MGTKFTADALDSPDSDWLSDRADIVNRPLKVTRQIAFRGPNRNEDAINRRLLVTPQLSNPPPNTDPDAFRRRLLTTPYPMTGLRRQGGYEDAGKFGGGHHGGRGRGGFGLRGMRGGFLSPIVTDYTEVVKIPVCYDQQGNRIPCPTAPNDAYALAKGASGLAPRRAFDQTGPVIGRNAGDLSDPQDFVRSERDWQGNPVISTIPMRKYRDEFHGFDGRLQNASGFGNAGLLPAGDWKKPFEKPDGRLYFSADSWRTLPSDKKHELTVYWNPEGGGFWRGKSATDSASAAARQAQRKAQIAKADEQLSLGAAAKAATSYVKAALPVAQTIVSFVPGVGAGVNAAIAAGSALAQGQSITDAVVGAAKNMLPGGPLAAKAFDAAYQMGKAAATGGNIGDAALHVARDNIPGGEVAKKAFDTGLAIAHGQNVQKALVSNAIDLAKSQGSAIAGNAINSLSGQALNAVKGAVNMPQILDVSTISNRAMNAVGPVIGAIPKSLPGVNLLPANVQMVAKALLANPNLRGLPIAEVANRMNVPVDAARQGLASVVSAVSKVPTSMGKLPSLAPAHEIANMISHNMSLDSAMSHFASKAAPVAFSPNATKKVGPAREIRWHINRAGKLQQIILKGSSISQARGFDAAGPGDTHSVIGSGSTGPDVVAWQNILLGAKSRIPGITISKADGQFGPMTKASTQAWQAANGLTPDGAVGPLTWSKALGTTPPAAQPVVIPASASTDPQGDLMNMPSLPAVAAAVAAKTAQMTGATHPLIQLGSTGPDVLAWQKIIGVTADGQFGPDTDAATRKWQAAHGLVADGKVGPATWAAATGVSTPNPGLSTVPVILGGASNPTLQTYLVTAGDTMSKIAQKFTGDSNRWRELAAANPQVKDPSKIFVGQVLTLPASWGSPQPEAPPTPSPTLGLPPGIPSLGDLLGGGGVQRTIAENPGGSIPATPLLPSISSTPTPEGPVVATTQDGTTVIDQPPITEKPKSAGLLVFGLAIGGMLLTSGKKLLA